MKTNIIRLIWLFCLLLLITTESLARWVTVKGQIIFEDGDPTFATATQPPGLDNKMWMPAHLAKVDLLGSAWRSQTFTDSEGRFSIPLFSLLNNDNIELLIEVDNYAVEVFADFDCVEERLLLSIIFNNLNLGTANEVNLGIIRVPLFYRPIEVDECYGNSTTIEISFAAALNINNVILRARDDVDNNRDPHENDTVGKVSVEYCDTDWNNYFSNLVLCCGRVSLVNDPLIVNPENNNNKDNGFVDAEIGHEYGHHLQYEIGTYDLHIFSLDHSLCKEIDTGLSNDPEFAWSEGFADYFGANLVASADSVEVFDSGGDNDWNCDPGENCAPGMTTTAGLNNVENRCSSPTYISSDDDRWISVEGIIASTLWDLTDGPGQGQDAWDQVDGLAINGHRRIMQIFDRELDTWDAPDLRDFYKAWRDRVGPNYAAGPPVLDPILNRYGVVPYGNSTGMLRKQPPEPIVELNPLLPDIIDASLSFLGSKKPQYAALLATPFGTFSGSDRPLVLTIRRKWSFLSANPNQPDDKADSFDIRIGISNLGPKTMEVDNGGTLLDSWGAQYNIEIDYLPSTVPDWLSVSPTSGSITTGPLGPGGSSTLQLETLVFRFLPSVFGLSGPNTYQADVNIRFVTTSGVVRFRKIRIIFDQWIDSGQEDPDGDGLTSQEEVSLAENYPCLSRFLADSDNDGLNDGDEVNVWKTSPCEYDTDGDGMGDRLESEHGCLNPIVPDADSDPDGDLLTNFEETIAPAGRPYSDPCNSDPDGDGLSDKEDNCPYISNPDKSDLDGDNYGDVCDYDIDGDGCPNTSDMFPRNPRYPTHISRCGLIDQSLEHIRQGFFAEIGDPSSKYNNPGIQILIEGIRPPNCSMIACPASNLKLFDAATQKIGPEIRPADWGFEANQGFVSKVQGLPDLDMDGTLDIALGLPNAATKAGLKRAGAVVIVSGRTGAELGRITSSVKDAMFGTTFALCDKKTLAIGAPGVGEMPGAVYLAQLSNFSITRVISMDEKGDEFGTSIETVPDLDGDSISELIIGAPNSEKRGGVYSFMSTDKLNKIGKGNAPGDRFGFAIVSAGDFGDDGNPEILVGAPGAASQTGEVTLLNFSGEPIWSQVGQEKGELFGYDLAVLIKDSVDTHVSDFLIGAPGWREKTGRVFALISEDEQPVSIISGRYKGAALGTHIVTSTDPDTPNRHWIVLYETNVEKDSASKGGRSLFYKWYTVQSPVISYDRQ